MSGVDRREAMLRDVRGACHEVATYDQLGDEVMPLLARALDCSGWHLSRTTPDNPVAIVRTNVMPAMQEYFKWQANDPLARALVQSPREPIIASSRLPGWRAIERHWLYAELAPSLGIRHIVSVNLNPVSWLRPGATTMVLMRAPRQRDFDGADLLALAQLLPALRAAERRSARTVATHARAPFLEALLESVATGARLALDAAGRPLWVSPDARRLLGRQLRRGHRLPEPLVAAAARALSGERAAARFVLDGGQRVVAELSPIAVPGRETCALAHLRPGDDDDALRALRQRHGLTRAEAAVLVELTHGGTNAEIARRRGVSTTTVNTQVARLLDKLGVHTRLEAALIATRARSS